MIVKVTGKNQVKVISIGKVGPEGGPGPRGDQGKDTSLESISNSYGYQNLFNPYHNGELQPIMIDFLDLFLNKKVDFKTSLINIDFKKLAINLDFKR